MNQVCYAPDFYVSFPMPKIVSANLNGIRSAAKKGFFEWMAKESADFICVQELKAQEADMTEDFLTPKGYVGHFHYAEKKGYSGVGLYSKRKPDAVRIGFGTKEFDDEGRYVECDFGDITVISLYCPSGSSSEERQQAKFRFMEVFLPHLQELKDSGREIVICGDWNIAHKEIDLKNWKSNQKNSGFLPEGRALPARLFCGLGPGGRVSHHPSGNHRRRLHLVEQSRPGVGQQRGLAHRLSHRHCRYREEGEDGGNLQGSTLLGSRTADD